MKANEKLLEGIKLTETEFLELIENREKFMPLFQRKAKELTEKIFGNKVYIRGLIEITNYCRNDCYYCGIRKSNTQIERYSLSDEEILLCCEDGFNAGFKTFVLQGGELEKDYTKVVTEIKKRYPECAITLSLGELSFDEYKALKNAGADRYLLRHETADKEHYGKLHPEKMHLETRMKCLKDIKNLGFQTGCGFMVGSPYQTNETLAKDLKFIQDFKPHMVGVGPFIPQSDTPFKNQKAGSVELTLYLLSILRLMLPNLLLPATTALGSIKEGGREEGILHGANVVMPNISPFDAREKYQLYDNKLKIGAETKEGLFLLEQSLNKIGRTICFERGDYKEKPL